MGGHNWKLVLLPRLWLEYHVWESRVQTWMWPESLKELQFTWDANKSPLGNQFGFFLGSKVAFPVDGKGRTSRHFRDLWNLRNSTKSIGIAGKVWWHVFDLASEHWGANSSSVRRFNMKIPAKQIYMSQYNHLLFILYLHKKSDQIHWNNIYTVNYSYFGYHR